MTLSPQPLRESFEKLSPNTLKFIHAFYQKLFTLYPDLESLFPGERRSEQGRRLLGALAFLLSKADEPETLSAPFKELGERHQKYRVKAEDFPKMKNAFLATFSEFLGDDWTPRYHEAWNEAYDTLSSLLLSGYKENSRKAA